MCQEICSSRSRLRVGAFLSAIGSGEMPVPVAPTPLAATDSSLLSFTPVWRSCFDRRCLTAQASFYSPRCQRTDVATANRRSRSMFAVVMKVAKSSQNRRVMPRLRPPLGSHSS